MLPSAISSAWTGYRSAACSVVPAASSWSDVRLTALDASQPTSTSRQTVAGPMRGEWRYDGLVITDDMCMGAIYFGRDGIEEASVRALNAGVDLLLASWDGEQIYPVLAAMLRNRGRLDPVALTQSAARLQAVQATLSAGAASR